MIGSDFLSKIRKEGRLKLVEPSEEVKGAYFQKSESHLVSARLLLEHGRLEEAVSMAYYSMYHAVMALFYRIGLKCENHTASILLLEKIFGLDAYDIAEAKKERIDKQYYIDFSVTEKEVKDLVRTAERFRSTIVDFTERLTSKDIGRFRERARRILRKVRRDVSTKTTLIGERE
jgi:uncharacterized protein (UPF0332 family)